jgi:hypothetical protein
MGERRYSSIILGFDTRQRWVVNFTLRSFQPREKAHGTQWTGGWVTGFRYNINKWMTKNKVSFVQNRDLFYNISHKNYSDDIKKEQVSKWGKKSDGFPLLFSVDFQFVNVDFISTVFFGVPNCPLCLNYQLLTATSHKNLTAEVL